MTVWDRGGGVTLNAPPPHHCHNQQAPSGIARDRDWYQRHGVKLLECRGGYVLGWRLRGGKGLQRRESQSGGVVAVDLAVGEGTCGSCLHTYTPSDGILLQPASSTRMRCVWRHRSVHARCRRHCAPAVAVAAGHRNGEQWRTSALAPFPTPLVVAAPAAGVVPAASGPARGLGTLGARWGDADPVRLHLALALDLHRPTVHQRDGRVLDPDQARRRLRALDVSRRARRLHPAGNVDCVTEKRELDMLRPNQTPRHLSPTSTHTLAHPHGARHRQATRTH
mmetsp:Transcript_40305/g.108129  ORF Transcript_40305/g.108129 Transcript_40305/m.108129 type:complete len:280 (-) Transcript_40305:250-1089(-)